MDDPRVPAFAEIVIGANAPAILIPEDTPDPTAWRIADDRLEVLGEDGLIAALDLGEAGMARAVIDRQNEVACFRIGEDRPVADWTLPRRA